MCSFTSRADIDAIAGLRQLAQHGYRVGTLCANCVRRIATHVGAVDEQEGMYPLCDECQAPPSEDGETTSSEDGAEVKLSPKTLALTVERQQVAIAAAIESRTRRADLKSQRLCISGKPHGPATHGTRCAWCAAVRRLGLAEVIKLEAEGKAPPRPPGYRPRRRENRLPDSDGRQLGRNGLRRRLGASMAANA